MKFLQLLFKLMSDYQILKYKLKAEFENFKNELSIHYMEVQKKLNLK